MMNDDVQWTLSTSSVPAVQLHGMRGNSGQGWRGGATHCLEPVVRGRNPGILKIFQKMCHENEGWMENRGHRFNPSLHLNIFETKTQVSESIVLDRVLVTDIQTTELQDFYDTNGCKCIAL